MPDFSEFASFVARKSGIGNARLAEKDILLHRLLWELRSSGLLSSYLFKGGSCLVKCYCGYYRFSVDLDFTWRDQSAWERLGKKELRRGLLRRIEEFASALAGASEKAGLKFESDLGERRFVEFGGGGRMVTFKLWSGTELVKVQVNFIEKLLFPPKPVKVNTLLGSARLSKEERAYFREPLEFYRPFKLQAYDEREILCEKVRAILTRRVQKLRDFYDLFVLSKHGFKLRDLKRQIVEKVRASLHYKKYRDNLSRNRSELRIGPSVLEDPFERSLLVTEPEGDFEDFLAGLMSELKQIADEALRS
jgi:predicted nucleotidyltransferase component of viral defense system